MRDFTLQAYAVYLNALLGAELNFVGFPSVIECEHTEFVLVRHDVDRRPARALAMARLEATMGVKATYYFRAKPDSFDPDIMQEIASLGHDLGYHYECLSDTGGDHQQALDLFDSNLQKFRELVEIETISMHGRPLSRYDNRDLWLEETRKQHLSAAGIKGEIYHVIDYDKIAYVNDTGRNWMSNQSNLRDQVNSSIDANFASSEALLDYFKNPQCRRIVFQVHPERWHDDLTSWLMQYAFDTGINAAKSILQMVRN